MLFLSFLSIYCICIAFFLEFLEMVIQRVLVVFMVLSIRFLLVYV